VYFLERTWIREARRCEQILISDRKSKMIVEWSVWQRDQLIVSREGNSKCRFWNVVFCGGWIVYIWILRLRRFLPLECTPEICRVTLTAFTIHCQRTLPFSHTRRISEQQDIKIPKSSDSIPRPSLAPNIISSNRCRD
jgi:hypothetical protein